VVQVAAGDAHTCARSSDGAARCWGGNAFGQVGAGDEVNHGVPVPVLGL
jgi:alpha-tubulin suppressor-like RCC1 family protein